MFFEFLGWLGECVWLLFCHVTGRSSFPKPLEAQKEKEAIEKMLQGDSEARALLIEHNLRLVAHIAKKYINSGMEQDDLISIGSIGLIKAVGSFKPENGTALSSYAARCIDNEMLMALRARKKLRTTGSLSDPIGSDKEGNEIQLLDILGTEGDIVLDEVEKNIESARAIKLLGQVLESRERTVVLLRYGLADGIPHPQHEVARTLGISRSYVSRIEKKALSKLRKKLEAGADDACRIN